MEAARDPVHFRGQFASPGPFRGYSTEADFPRAFGHHKVRQAEGRAESSTPDPGCALVEDGHVCCLRLDLENGGCFLLASLQDAQQMGYTRRQTLAGSNDGSAFHSAVASESSFLRRCFVCLL